MGYATSGWILGAQYISFKHSKPLGRCSHLVGMKRNKLFSSTHSKVWCHVLGNPIYNQY